MTAVAQTLANFQAKFNPEAAGSISTVFQFNVTDATTHCLVVQNGTCVVTDGVNEDANVTFVMDTDTLTKMSDGSLDGMQAFMSGKLRVEGDMMLALKLSELFSN